MLHCLLNKFVKNDASSPGYLSYENVKEILQGNISIPEEFYDQTILTNYCVAVEQLRQLSPVASDLKFVKNIDSSETITCLIFNNKQLATMHLHHLETVHLPVYLNFIAARDSLLLKFKVTRYATKYVEVNDTVILHDFDTLNALFNG